MSREVAEKLTPDQLRELFLFESLGDEHLDWIAAKGTVEEFAAGEKVFHEGDPATCFFVLLSGAITSTRRVEGTEVEVSRTDQRGVYGGATLAFVRSEDTPAYVNTFTAVTDARFLQLDAPEFGQAFRTWFPMAMHLLEGFTLGFRSSQAIVGQRERLLSLGRLSAGLTHELNNPAAAAVRATATLRERVTKMRRKLGYLATMKIDSGALQAMTTLQEEAVEQMGKAMAGGFELSAVEASDREDELGEWLEDHAVINAWDLTPILAAAGVTNEWLEGVAGAMPADQLPHGIGWVAYALETEQLMSEIEDSTHRISALVGAARQYSQIDRAPHQDIVLKEGIHSTLVMLGHKLKQAGITLAKEFEADLPLVPAYPAELNQVWTNLIDNAIGAMPDGGTLTLRGRLDGDRVLIEVQDSGGGIPAELQSRIFEPFFTTKPVGEGTGLGLDICYRVVTQRHGGDLRVESEPGRTVFRVWLPTTEQPSR